MIGDFHTHINGAGNTLENAKKLGTMAKEKGMTCISLGCHEWLCPKTIADIVENECGIKVVRFMECACENNIHILAMNIQSDGMLSKKFQTVEYYIREIKRQKGKAILAHPANEQVLNKYSRLFDGVELWNTKYNRAYPAAKKHPHLKKFYNSNFHVWEDDPAIFGIMTEVEETFFE